MYFVEEETRRGAASSQQSASLRRPVVSKYKQLFMIFVRCLQYTSNVISNTPTAVTNTAWSRSIIQSLCHNRCAFAFIACSLINSQSRNICTVCFRLDLPTLSCLSQQRSQKNLA